MTPREYEEDIDFLLARASQAGRCGDAKDRDTGMSSNSLVNIAYYKLGLHVQVLPSDQADLDACERTYNKLPRHRKTERAYEALKRARAVIDEKKAKR